MNVTETLETFDCHLQYPVSEFLHQLGFETQEEVENFCRHHGLSVENGQVLLDKTRFSDSEIFPVCRSQSLVEGKQKCSLGEVSY